AVPVIRSRDDRGDRSGGERCQYVRLAFPRRRGRPRAADVEIRGELHRVAGLECGVRCCLAEIPHESRHQRTTRTFRAEVAFHGVDLAVPEQWLVAVLAFPFAQLPQTGLILFLGVWQVAREALELDGEAPGVRVRRSEERRVGKEGGCRGSQGR